MWNKANHFPISFLSSYIWILPRARALTFPRFEFRMSNPLIFPIRQWAATSISIDGESASPVSETSGPNGNGLWRLGTGFWLWGSGVLICSWNSIRLLINGLADSSQHSKIPYFGGVYLKSRYSALRVLRYRSIITLQWTICIFVEPVHRPTKYNCCCHLIVEETKHN